MASGETPEPRARYQRFLRWLSTIALLGCMGCWAAYRIIGSEIDDDGFLREPFALIPIGWLLFLVGIVAGGLYLFRDLTSRLAPTGTSTTDRRRR